MGMLASELDYLLVKQGEHKDDVITVPVDQVKSQKNFSYSTC